MNIVVFMSTACLYCIQIIAASLAEGNYQNTIDPTVKHGYGRTSWVMPGCAGGRGFAPGRGNSKESVSSCQETGKVFYCEMP